ncbi:MAG: hypothetical protein KatS3mg119_0335 [Rhodothalassiaceae bacterium]|nr:MAG: hypothetical protein KatS3mg119_0335 [Rhodothalassiaceae bacterium]
MRPRPVTGFAAAFAAGCALAAGAAGAADAPRHAQERTIAPFSRLLLKGAADVHFRVGRERRAVVRGEDARAVRETSLAVDGGRLVITGPEGRCRREIGVEFCRTPRVVVEVTAPAPEAVTIAGAGDVTLEDLSGSDLKVVLEGAGDMRLSGRCGRLAVELEGAGDVDARELACRELAARLTGAGDLRARAAPRIAVTLAGAGDAEITGRCKQAEITVRGAGDVEGGLVCRKARVTASGPGDVTLTVTDELAVTHNGPGDVRIHGHPTLLEVNAGGPGRFKLDSRPASSGS